MPVNPFSSTGVGIPGGVGGGVLGLGIVLSLHDQFSKQANLAKAQLAGLSGAVDKHTARMNRNLVQLQASLAGLAIGMGLLAAVSFPIKSAMQFEEMIQRVRVVAGDKIPLPELETMAIDLAAMFPQDATEMADSLRITIAAGISDIHKARALLESTMKLAVATQSKPRQVIQGMTSFVNAYQMGLDETFTAEAAQLMYDQLGSALLETMKHGKFSASSDITDIEQMSKFFGQIAPTAAALNIDFKELLAIWATATLGGQDARRSATGLRQAFMDLNNRQRELSSWTGFRNFAQDSEFGNGFDFTSGNLPGFVQQYGMMDMLDLVSEYAMFGSTPEQRAQLANLLETPNMQRNLEVITSTLPEDMTHQEALASSEHYRALVEGVRSVGGLDIAKVNEVFRSIWGLTAVLPLVGVQRDKMRETYAAIEKAVWENELQIGFEKIMNTVNQQWALFTSKLETVRILWGRHMLAPVRDFLKFLNKVVDVTIVLSRRFGDLAAIIMQVATGTGIFMSTFFGILTVSKGLAMVNMAFRDWMKQLRWFPRYVRGGLMLMFKDIIAAVTLIIAVTMAVRKAWDSNFMGMTDSITVFWNRLTTLINSIRLLFKRLDDTGQGFLTMEEYNKLLEVGLHPGTVAVVYSFLYRVREGLFGLRDGFVGFFQSIQNGFGRLKGTIFDPLYQVFDWLRHALRRLMEPTEDNVVAWRRWGERIGTLLAAATSFMVAFGGIASILRMLAVTLAMWRPAVAVLAGLAFKPLVLGLLALGGVLAWLGKDRLKGFWDGLVGPEGQRKVQQLAAVFRDLPLSLRTFGGPVGTADVVGRILGLDVAPSERLSQARAYFDRLRTVMPVLWANRTNLGAGNTAALAFRYLTGMTVEQAIQGVKEGAGKAWGAIVKMLPESLVNYLTAQYENVTKAVTAFFDGIKQGAERAGVDKTLENLANLLPNFLNSLASFARGFGEGIGDSGLNTIRRIGESLVSIINRIAELTGDEAQGGWHAFGKTVGTIAKGVLAVIDLLLLTLNSILDWDFKAFRERLSGWWKDTDLPGLAKFGILLFGALTILSKVFGAMQFIGFMAKYSPLAFGFKTIFSIVWKLLWPVRWLVGALWKLTGLGPKLAAFWSGLGAKALAALARVGGALRTFFSVKFLGNAFARMGGLISSFFSKIYMLPGVINKMWPVLVARMKMWMFLLPGELRAIWGTLVAKIRLWMFLLPGELKAFWGTLVAKMRLWMFMLPGELKAFFGTIGAKLRLWTFLLMGNLKAAWGTLVAKFRLWLYLILGPLKRWGVVFLSRFSGIIGALPGIFLRFLPGIGAVILALTGAYLTNLWGFRDWVDGLREAFNDGGLIGASQYFTSSLLDGFNSFRDWFLGTPLVDTIKNWFSGVREWFEENFGWLITFLEDIDRRLREIPFLDRGGPTSANAPDGASNAISQVWDWIGPSQSNLGVFDNDAYGDVLAQAIQDGDRDVRTLYGRAISDGVVDDAERAALAEAVEALRIAAANNDHPLNVVLKLNDDVLVRALVRRAERDARIVGAR